MSENFWRNKLREMNFKVEERGTDDVAQRAGRVMLIIWWQKGTAQGTYYKCDDGDGVEGVGKTLEEAFEDFIYEFKTQNNVKIESED